MPAPSFFQAVEEAWEVLPSALPSTSTHLPWLALSPRLGWCCLLLVLFHEGSGPEAAGGLSHSLLCWSRPGVCSWILGPLYLLLLWGLQFGCLGAQWDRSLQTLRPQAQDLATCSLSTSSSCCRLGWCRGRSSFPCLCPDPALSSPSSSSLRKTQGSRSPADPGRCSREKQGRGARPCGGAGPNLLAWAWCAALEA